MSTSTTDLVHAYCLELEFKTDMSYRRQAPPQRYSAKPTGHGKQRRRAGLGIRARSNRRSTYLSLQNGRIASST